MGWTRDAPSFQFVWLTMCAMGLMVAQLFRQIFYNPDVYFRRQECKKPMQDRHRQWSYSLPYYNHHMRNMAVKYKFAFVDNDWNWNDEHPLGYRPNRGHSHRRPMFWVYTCTRYTCEDPLLESTRYENFNKIYEEVGYQTVKRMEP